MAEQALFQPFNRNQQRENLESTKETGLLISLIPSLQEDFISCMMKVTAFHSAFSYPF